MVEEVRTAPGEFRTVSFLVNTRTLEIVAVEGIAPGQVRLKAPRETVQEAWAWDRRLTLEFGNARPAVCAVELARCIIQGIRDDRLAVAAEIVGDLKNFDPAQPDPPEAFKISASPTRSSQRPLGN